MIITTPIPNKEWSQTFIVKRLFLPDLQVKCWLTWSPGDCDWYFCISYQKNLFESEEFRMPASWQVIKKPYLTF